MCFAHYHDDKCEPEFIQHKLHKWLSINNYYTLTSRICRESALAQLKSK
ncbi:hypothetical protein Sbal183_1915 [Shewanella baltica OS183]|nr:hypothetical protein Sbal175_2387 [Shewanella baltica BA175]EHQ14827.1 hypothetical protein Sbal183_1915 [Shewanella baltica OS183]